MITICIQALYTENVEVKVRLLEKCFIKYRDIYIKAKMLHVLNGNITLNDIGIRHGFLCINICWAPREAWEQMLMHRKQCLIPIVM